VDGGVHDCCVITVMLGERIDAVAPQMPADIRRWFLEPTYAAPSVEHQDWDLSLAEWDFVPLLADYATHRANPTEKRFEALAALMVLQRSVATTPADAERKTRINRELESVVLRDREFARQACSEWLGLVEALVIKRILGEPIPHDVPQWVHEQVQNRA
jgi:hypothetical protein